METETTRFSNDAQATLDPTAIRDFQGLMSNSEAARGNQSAEDGASAPRIGSIYSYTTVHQSHAGGDPEYTLALVRLSNGPLVMGKIIGASGDRLVIGGAVEQLPNECSHSPCTTRASGVFFGLRD